MRRKVENIRVTHTAWTKTEKVCAISIPASLDVSQQIHQRALFRGNSHLTGESNPFCLWGNIVHFLSRASVHLLPVPWLNLSSGHTAP